MSVDELTQKKLRTAYNTLLSYIHEYSDLLQKETSEHSKSYDAGVVHGLLLGRSAVLRILGSIDLYREVIQDTEALSECQNDH